MGHPLDKVIMEQVPAGSQAANPAGICWRGLWTARAKALGASEEQDAQGDSVRKRVIMKESVKVKATRAGQVRLLASTPSYVGRACRLRAEEENYWICIFQRSLWLLWESRLQGTRVGRRPQCLGGRPWHLALVAAEEVVRSSRF